MEVSFEELRRVQLHEKNHAALSRLDEGFFSSFKKRLEVLQQELDDEFSLDAEKEYVNSLRILREVVERRQQKIITKAQRDFQVGEVASDGLASEEKQLYVSILKLFGEHKSNVLNDLAFEDVKIEKPSGKGEIKVKIIQDVPKFVGCDSKQCGPFKAGEDVFLAKVDAELLVKHGVAKEAKQQIYA